MTKRKISNLRSSYSSPDEPSYINPLTTLKRGNGLVLCHPTAKDTHFLGSQRKSILNTEQIIITLLMKEPMLKCFYVTNQEESNILTRRTHVCGGGGVV